MNHHIKHYVEKIPAYLEDTPHFLRVLEQENEIGPPLENVILVTIEVSSLYTNIPLFEGIEEVRNVLQDREDISVPTEFICRMLEQVLTAKIFEFDQKLFLQKIGTAMGTVCAPPFANIFMNKIDILLRELARNIVKDNEDPIRLYKRFLDDIFMVWTGSVEDLQTFLKGINNLHPTIKFTAEFTSPYFCEMEGPHDCFCHQTQSVPFLDTSVSVKQGKFSTDLYKKPTDRCKYLLPSSCHPSHIVKNIPYNLAYRILRICSEKENLTKRLSELKTLLISREYREKSVEDAISRVLKVSRMEAIKKVEKVKNERPVFVLTYNPALPSVSQSLQKHWRVMMTDPYLKKVFPKPPMVAFRRTQNLRSKLIKAKVPPPPPKRKKRDIHGMKKCNNPRCEACPFILAGKEVKSPFCATSVTINADLDCNSKNVIYGLFCDKNNCKQIYIGKTERTLKERLFEHKNSVRNEAKIIRSQEIILRRQSF